MSEENPSYLHPKGELRFVRLKNTFEDIVGYVNANEGYLTIFQPLRVEIETMFNEGRQILSMQEYLPQSIIDIKEVKIQLTDIMFIAPVKWDFYDQYKQVSEFFYGNDHQVKKKSSAEKSKNKIKKEETMNGEKETEENKENVISILEALAKKDKSIH